MSKRLFVGGLPYSLTDSQLMELFSQVGNVLSANVITDKFTGRSKGFGFVEMDKEEDADKAIETLNGKEVDGRKIAVNVAKPLEERGTRNFPQQRRSFERRDSDRRGRRGYR